MLWKRAYHSNNIYRCSFISNAELLIDCFILAKKRASNTALLLIYDLLGLFLNVINDKSLLKAWNIHQQNCMPLKQVLREFENFTMQSSTVSISLNHQKNWKQVRLSWLSSIREGQTSKFASAECETTGKQNLSWSFLEARKFWSRFAFFKGWNI